MHQAEAHGAEFACHNPCHSCSSSAVPTVSIKMAGANLCADHNGDVH